MTEVNSPESYYQYRAETDSRLKEMSAEITRLKNEIKDNNLAAAIDRQVRDSDVSNLIFNLTRASAIETDNGFSIGDRSLPDAIESIRDNSSLKRFFSGTDILAPEPKRVYKQWWD